MFRRRLLVFSIILGVLAVIVVARLAQIQIVQAAHYEQLAERILAPVEQFTAAPRGSVLDRRGVLLLRDQPTSDVAVHYAVLAGRDDYLMRLAAQMRRRGEFPKDMSVREISDELRGRINLMWRRLSQLTGLPVSEFARRSAAVCERVERLKAHILERSPNVRRLAEEERGHPILEDVDPNLALVVRTEMEGLPWIAVEPGARRIAASADDVAHLLGRLGAAGPERIAADPLRDDDLRRLRPGDRCGVSGIERLAETALRGVRGRITYDVEGREIERTLPAPGRDVYLTIDLELQHEVMKLLATAVADSISPSGASAVVIDVESREVLALASYPTYVFETFADNADALRRDTVRLPLLFRAVQAQYPPGSICKAITLVGGLTEGLITPQTTFECRGHLLPNEPDRFRCWIYNQEPRGVHGEMDGELAVKNSCNIYFFHVGEKLGAERLCGWFSRFGLGRTQGTGLIEESPAIVPDEAWLAANQRRTHQPADAWNYAIGQGEVTVTPLQAANVAATIASGFFAPVRLAYDSSGALLGDALPAEPPFDERWLAVLRRGMKRVVNDRNGTAHWARLDTPGYELCGKTGSAQTVPRVVNTRYILEWPDGRREEQIAISADDALAAYKGDKPTIVGWRAHERYPQLLEGEKLPSHAWFVGFTQSADTSAGTRPRGKVYAISVVIEFGGSGGRVAGPVAKQIAELLLSRDWGRAGGQ